MTLYVNGIEVEVTRKRIKNLHLYVKSPLGNVVVTAPQSMPDGEIENFVRSKEPWIREHVARIRSNPVTPEPKLVTGETISVWGDLFVLEVRSGPCYSLSLHYSDEGDSAPGRAIFTVRDGATTEQKAAFLDRWYKQQLKERVDLLLPKWEAYTGLHSSGWSQRTMTSRWGSCNTGTNHINLNTRLAEHPPECLDYVILHELCHTVVPNHGPDFKALEDRYMPDWRTVRKRLNNK